MRERIATAPRSLADHELLELLLTYAIPRKDTKAIAKEMLLRFGSVGGCLGAAPERLAEIPGLGQATVSFWRTLQECMARKAHAPLQERVKFSSPDQVRELVCSRLGHLTKEEFWLLLVDNQNRLVLFEPIMRGTVDQTAAYPREIIEVALRHHASGIILVHNHPGGNPQPSHQDKVLTESLSHLCAELGLRLLDHLIVVGSDFSSFRALGLI